MDRSNQNNNDLLPAWETDILRSIIHGKSLPRLLEEITLGIEHIINGGIASILLLDPDRKHLRHGAAPSLSKEYCELINGSEIGPATGSCGTAAFTKRAVIVSDIASDPLWIKYKDIAARENLKACWSTPIFDKENQVTATFAVYYREIREPHPGELAMIDRMAQIVSLAIENNRKEQALKANELQIKEAFDGAATGIAITDMNGRFLQVNPAYLKIVEYSEEELLQLDFQSITHPADRDRNADEIKELISGRLKSAVLEKKYISKTGKIIWVKLSVSVRRDLFGNPSTLMAIVEDVSSLKDAELKQAESEQLLSSLMSNLPGVVYRCKNDEFWTMTYISDAVQELTGYAASDLINNHKVTFSNLIHSDDQSYIDYEIQNAIKNRSHFQLEYRIRKANGEIVWLWEQGKALVDESDDIAYLEGYITDITLQKTAELALAETQRQASAILKSVGGGILCLDENGMISFANNAAINVLAWNEGEMIGKESHQLIHHHHSDGSDYLLDDCPVHLTLNDGRVREVSDEVFFKKDGSSFPVKYIVSPVLDESGDPIGAVVSFNDISKQLALEDQLRQSQKLESLGQLTGGVAHDFNNLLTVIIGNAESLEESLESAPHLKALATMVIKAGLRGSELTQALLAFARKQPLDPKVVDLNELLTNIKVLLQRALGENFEIRISQAADLWRAVVDPAQLESALLNLVINARDAMKGSGCVTIETINTVLDAEYAFLNEAIPGEYVMVAVSDTGEGISQEHLKRVFEPFYTTKEKGKGTGLGLAMVYGFIKQSGGHVNIYSEVGHGTSVRMYLPRIRSESQSSQLITEESLVVSGSEIILLVEDDVLVRTYANTLLNSLGYSVIQAENGHLALEIIKSQTKIDLLFTDVVMPGGMSGKELADLATEIRPGLKVLFTSGYTESTIIHNGRLDPGVQLLSKPYRRSELAKKIRTVLEIKDSLTAMK
jgi:PAS domain S-box-containing protein